MKKETHKELIICPECQHQGYGTVIHTVPFFTYIHVCKACDYVITESDWNVVKTETITQDEMLYLTIGNYGGFVQLDQDEDTILLQKSRIPELIKILQSFMESES